MTIRAEIHSDDDRHQVVFDATAWFIEASDQEIDELADCGWGGDYPADGVALWYEDRDRDVGRLLDYCHRQGRVGFECHVEEDDALAWLRANRPALAHRIERRRTNQ